MKIPEFSDITLEIRHENGVTIALAFAEGYEGQGIARCHPDDSFSIGVGRGLAVGRALKDLGRTYEREAYSTVHRIDAGRKRSRAMRELRRQERKAQGLPINEVTAPTDVQAPITPNKKSFLGKATRRPTRVKH